MKGLLLHQSYTPYYIIELHYTLPYSGVPYSTNRQKITHAKTSRAPYSKKEKKPRLDDHKHEHMSHTYTQTRTHARSQTHMQAHVHVRTHTSACDHVNLTLGPYYNIHIVIWLTNHISFFALKRFTIATLAPDNIVFLAHASRLVVTDRLEINRADLRR